MTQHGPGVVCIVVGVKDSWGSKNNGRLVVIRKLDHVKPKKGPYWRCEARPGEPPLYVWEYTNVSGILPGRKRTAPIPQKHLIPIRPEEEFNEQVVGSEVDDGEFVLC